MELNEDVILSVKDLHFAYAGHQKEVLKGLSCEIKRGEIVAVLGSNGAGKSTFFNLITGLVKNYKGSIKLKGKEIRELDHSGIAKTLSLVPQKHEPLFPFSVKDFILMGRYSKIGIFGNPTKDDLAAVEKAAVETGAIRFMDMPYNELSGGEMQLAVIARALAQETEILVLDEPSNHLDFKNQFTIFNLINEISKKRNTTLIMSLHNPNDVLLFSQRAIVLSDGVVAAEGDVSKIISSDLLAKVFGVNAICIEGNGRKAFLPDNIITS